MSPRDRESTPILDAVRRERGEVFPYGKPASACPWTRADAPSPEQLREAERLLADAPALTLED